MPSRFQLVSGFRSVIDNTVGLEGPISHLLWANFCRQARHKTR